jgi:hypothetical protein
MGDAHGDGADGGDAMMDGDGDAVLVLCAVTRARVEDVWW